MPVLLTGPAGSGKSTILTKAAKAAGVKYSFMTCTKQMSVNALIGFLSINGTYVPSILRQAYENGWYFNLDEIDAADANVLLVLNSLEQGLIAWPDGYDQPPHPDFRLCATANPQDSHSIYTGRSKLDFSTLDRYYTINIELDDDLELALTSPEVVAEANIARTLLKAQGSSLEVTMRDTIRIQRLTDLGLDEHPIERVVFYSDPSLLAMYHEQKSTITAELEAKLKQAQEQAAKDAMTQKDATNLDDFWDKIQQNQ